MWLLWSKIKENVFSDTPVKNYLAYIILVEIIPYSTHSKLKYTKQQITEGLHPPLILPNHFYFGTKLCTPLGQGCHGSPQACLTHFDSYCKLKEASPVGVILQLTEVRGNDLTVGETAWALPSGSHGVVSASTANPSDSSARFANTLVLPPSNNEDSSTPIGRESPTWAVGVESSSEII